MCKCVSASRDVPVGQSVCILVWFGCQAKLCVAFFLFRYLIEIEKEGEIDRKKGGNVSVPGIFLP